MTFSRPPSTAFSTQMFASSPTHQQRLNSGQSSLQSSPLSRSKRTNSDYDCQTKKVKDHTQYDSPNPEANMTLESIDLEQYPQFHHPDGGIIQFTPIGNIRSMVNPATNQVERLIENNSKFDLTQTQNGIDGYKIFLGDSSNGGQHVHGASCSTTACGGNDQCAEPYMANGYAQFSSHAGCCGDDYDCDSDLDFDDDDHDCHMH